MKKIKWKNLGLSILFIGGCGLLIHDFYRLAIEPFVTGELTGITLYGIVTFLIVLVGMEEIFEYLKKEME